MSGYADRLRRRHRPMGQARSGFNWGCGFCLAIMFFVLMGCGFFTLLYTFLHATVTAH